MSIKYHQERHHLVSVFYLETDRDCLVEAAEDGHHVRHVQHPLVLASEAVSVKSLDRDVERQEVN